MEKFFFVLILAAISLAIYSSGYDNGAASTENLIAENLDMESQISGMNSCIESLMQDKLELEDMVDLADSALDATEPISYEELIEGYSGAKDILSGYSSSLSGDCDF